VSTPDLAEIILAIEAGLDIEMKDSDVEHLLTVGDLHDALLHYKPPTEAWTAMLTVFEVYGVPAEKITPETRLDSLFPA
jgi:hypothetical protein